MGTKVNSPDMIKHIVLFKLSPATLTEEKQGQLNKLKEIFSPFGKKLPFMKSPRL
jgi:hypothetical protein